MKISLWAVIIFLTVLLAMPSARAVSGSETPGINNGSDAPGLSANTDVPEGHAEADATGNNGNTWDYGDTNASMTGYISITQTGEYTLPPPNYSFIYRYFYQLEERREYEDRKRMEAIAAQLAAEEAKRLDDMRQRVASLTDEELGELYTQEYFSDRLRVLGYYRKDHSNENINNRDAIIRLQASMNLQVDAVLGHLSKKALIEGSPVVPHDEVVTPASSGYWITINKSKNILTVYEGSSVHKKYPVATGRRPSLTPEGKFTFVSKSVNPAWGGGGYASPVAGGSPSNPLGKRWLGLSIGGGGRYGVHGNAAPSSIGTYASAGCVRMINSDVESMFEYIPVGTPVWIGSDSKLAEFGIKQYYTLTEPSAAADNMAEADAQSGSAAGSTIGDGGSHAGGGVEIGDDAADWSRAELIIFDDDDL